MINTSTNYELETGMCSMCKGDGKANDSMTRPRGAKCHRCGGDGLRNCVELNEVEYSFGFPLPKGADVEEVRVILRDKLLNEWSKVERQIEYARHFLSL